MNEVRIYLDWNVITNLINPSHISEKGLRDEFVFLKDIFEQPESNLIIPYSNAHLSDLMNSYKKGKRKSVFDKLDYLSFLTKNVCIAQYWNEENAKWHMRNPAEFFNSILQDDLGSFDTWDDIVEPLKEYGIDKVFDLFKFQPHGMDFEQIEKQSPFFASLFPKAKNEGSMYAAIQDVFDILSKIKSNPVVYKELRKMFKEGLNVDSNISNYENAIKSLDEYLLKSPLNKSFTDLYELNNKNSPLANKDYEKLIGIYMQLDFVGYNSDKLTSKNQYDNLFNDSLHCFYAAHCDFFITNDNRSYKKCKAVFENENIGTLVFKTQELVEILSKK